MELKSMSIGRLAAMADAYSEDGLDGFTKEGTHMGKLLIELLEPILAVSSVGFFIQQASHRGVFVPDSLIHYVSS